MHLSLLVEVLESVIPILLLLLLFAGRVDIIFLKTDNIINLFRKLNITFQLANATKVYIIADKLCELRNRYVNEISVYSGKHKQDLKFQKCNGLAYTAACCSLTELTRHEKYHYEVCNACKKLHEDVCGAIQNKHRAVVLPTRLVLRKGISKEDLKCSKTAPAMNTEISKDVKNILGLEVDIQESLMNYAPLNIIFRFFQFFPILYNSITPNFIYFYIIVYNMPIVVLRHI
jgi:hypothetical protein